MTNDCLYAKYFSALMFFLSFLQLSRFLVSEMLKLIKKDKNTDTMEKGAELAKCGIIAVIVAIVTFSNNIAAYYLWTCADLYCVFFFSCCFVETSVMFIIQAQWKVTVITEFMIVYLYMCCRSASFSQSTRSNTLLGSNSPVQKLSYGFSNCLNGTGAQLHGFYSLPKPGKHPLSVHDDSSQDACYVLPRGYSSEAPPHSSLGDPDFENEVYTFKTPCNTLATTHSNERSPDNYDFPTTPGSFYQIPRTFDKNHNSLTPSSSESSCAPPPRPPKPNQGSEGNWGSPHSAGSQNGEMTSAVSALPRRNTLPAVENIRLHRGRQSFYNCLPLSCFQIQVSIDHLCRSDFTACFHLPLSPFPSSISLLTDLSQAAEQKQRAQCSRHCFTETLMKFKSYHLILNVLFQTDEQ